MKVLEKFNAMILISMLTHSIIASQIRMSCQLNLKISRTSTMTTIDKHIVIEILQSNNDKEHTDLSLPSLFIVFNCVQSCNESKIVNLRL